MPAIGKHLKDARHEALERLLLHPLDRFLRVVESTFMDVAIRTGQIAALRHVDHEGDGTARLHVELLGRFARREKKAGRAQFRDVRRDRAGVEIRVGRRISSPGGDAFCGSTISNLLIGYKGTVTARIDGFAFSSAALVAMAADKIVAPENAYMLIHEPIGMVIGPAAAHYAMADDLDRITGLDAAFANRAKQSVEAVRALMAQNRLMVATEAKSSGYVDELTPSAELVATFDLDKIPTEHRRMVVTALAGDPRADQAVFMNKRALQKRLRAERGGFFH